MAREVASKGSEDDIRAYKRVLSLVLETRPSGARQRLADALGKHRSFITQITSPAYPTPVPHQHVATILAVCHFGPADRKAFLEAYARAHPGRLESDGAARPVRTLNLSVPDLGSARDNAAFDSAITEFINKLAGLMRPSGGNE